MQPGIKARPFRRTDPTAVSTVASSGSSEPALSELALSGIHQRLLQATVLVGGASVMIVEILGSRILAPSFGTTLHVWSALITVTLAALALGYAVGGRVADYRSGLGTLMFVMTCASGTLLFSALVTKVVLRAASGAGLVSGTFIAAVLLFLPTLFLLGMISPMAVRATVNQQQLGTSIGNLYALSTIGSVAGSLSVSLLLIPHLAVHVAVISTAVALGLIPLCYLLVHSKWLMALLLFLGLSLGALTTEVLGEKANRTVMYKNQAYPVTARIPSAYGDLVVSDHKGVRYLFLNGVQQGSLIGDVSYARYAYGIERLATAKGIPKSILIWGLGAGVLARTLAEAGAQITVIEIDPMSEKVAREYFGLPAAVKVIIGDARTETLRLKEKYEVIVLDAFNGDTPPAHLLTREAFQSVRDRMEPNGLVVLNIVGGISGPESRLVSSVAATMENVFGQTSVFSPNWYLAGKKSSNFISTLFLVAGDLPVTPAPFTLKVSEEARRINYLDSVFASRIALPHHHAVILTDDYAPLEAWFDAAVQVMRY